MDNIVSYRVNPQIGKCRHSISTYDGVSTHKDGSPFWGLQTFKTKRKKEQFIRGLNKRAIKAA